MGSVHRQTAGAKPTRRALLKAASLAVLGGSFRSGYAKPVATQLRRRSDTGRNCIFLLLNGGPSQLDTFDPKPDAPLGIRSPFRPLRTNVPGIYLTELLPHSAKIADKFAIVRSMCHRAPGLHDAGHQLLQTGHFYGHGWARPNIGAACEYLLGAGGPLPGHVLLPGPLGNTGGGMPHGQDGGSLGAAYDPLVIGAALPSAVGWGAVRDASELRSESDATRDAYGDTEFGRSCLLARRLVERGVRFATVNMFRTLAGAVTWDAHGAEPFSGISAYRGGAASLFDRVYAALLTDLERRGLLERTLVIAAGEFGRSPRINRAGGRDHWPECWSILVAGGRVRGGQVIGASDATGAAPADRPVSPSEIVATICQHLGVDPQAEMPGPDGVTVPLLEPGVRHVHELF